jgi:DNA repair photolyase
MLVVRPGVPAPSLAARMGTEVVRERGGVRYLELETRSLLGRCSSPRMPFRWTSNPYRGCTMGCRYCYATYTHEFMGITTPEEFHSTVYVKTGGDMETTRALALAVRRGELMALGAATDPYQPGEAEWGVTRRFLEKVAQHRGARLGITTKGAGILRDVELLRKIHERSSLSIHVSLISVDAALLRKLEPWAPPPDVRLEMMRRLTEAGLEVWLALAPILPAITDDEPALDRLLGAVRATGVRRLFSNVLFLRSPTKEKYLRFVEQEFPRLLEAYRNAYGSQVYLGGTYRRRVAERMTRLQARHGFLTERMRDAGGDGAGGRQLLLWE